MIDQLIRYANILDRRGRYGEADKFDKLASIFDDDSFIVNMIKEVMMPDASNPKYIIRDQKVKFKNQESNPPPPNDWVDMKSAFNLNGDYIGDPETAHFLIMEKGIIPELSSKDHSVCSIGFNPNENKYFGWSHRAINGYGIGDDDFVEESMDPNKKIPNSDEAWSISQSRAQRKRQIKTLEEAKKAAINFAKSVS